MKGVGHEGEEDVRFNALLLLVMDRPQRQVPFQVLERFLDMDQLGVELPHLGGVAANQVGSKQIPALTASAGP